MGEANLPQFLLNQPPPRRRLPAQQTRFSGMRGGGGGEIVEVQGGHIVRATGRKDRHSKVCTAKGPRDRRVRLSAHTAIQFYDVQDRLGYDRPSKAVDWLIMNAKAAIDELAELPAWHPTTTTYPNPSPNQPPQDELQSPGDSGKRPMALAEPLVSVAFGFGGGSSSNSFLPPSLDSDAIADTIKSFFPMAAAASATAPSSSAPIGYQNFPPDLLSRTSSQDLRLSLQSFQDPIFHHPHHQNHMGFDAASSGWSDHNQRMVPWNLAETGGGSGGFMFNVPPPQALPLHPGLSQAHLFTQRGPLQSSSSPSVRAWADPMPPATDHPMQLELHPLVASIGFASGSSGFSGFRIPARIQGEEEHDDGMSDKPSSASSASHH